MAGYSSQELPNSVVWVPCIPDYTTGELIPMYTINNFPSYTSTPTKPLISRGGIKNKDWTHIEDAKLIGLVESLGTKQWANIAKEINKSNNNWSIRKGKHCRERWHNHLDPKINKGEWSYEEDLVLLSQHKIHGNKWSKISKVLIGRTENSVKNRLNSLIKNAKQSTSSAFITNDTIVDILIQQFSELVNTRSL
ncbi:hypothetical protein SteCoe_14276 [Stentor coeruleus]|uniref:Myb-like DNA-binding domain containing protein n=1 Tax=Stentor coeruleus TaxID=5963 RepID=A0A1R2C6E8_9CILI|nr:hypothetical protein SteCoe_14276 [Stentor coeruleus]